MSLSSEAYAQNPEIQEAVKHARVAQTIECVKMIRYMRRNYERNAAAKAAYREIEIYLLAAARRLKRGEKFFSGTSAVEELTREAEKLGLYAKHWAKVDGAMIETPMDGNVQRFPNHPVIGKIFEAAMNEVRIEPLTEEECRQLPLKNRLIWDLVKAAESGKRLSPNDIAIRCKSFGMYTFEEVREVYLQIGYSVCGIAKLSYFDGVDIDSCCWQGSCKKEEKR